MALSKLIPARCRKQKHDAHWVLDTYRPTLAECFKQLMSDRFRRQDSGFDTDAGDAEDLAEALDDEDSPPSILYDGCDIDALELRKAEGGLPTLQTFNKQLRIWNEHDENTRQQIVQKGLETIWQKHPTRVEEGQLGRSNLAINQDTNSINGTDATSEVVENAVDFVEELVLAQEKVSRSEEVADSAIGIDDSAVSEETVKVDSIVAAIPPALPRHAQASSSHKPPLPVIKTKLQAFMCKGHVDLKQSIWNTSENPAFRTYNGRETGLAPIEEESTSSPNVVPFPGEADLQPSLSSSTSSTAWPRDAILRLSQHTWTSFGQGDCLCCHIPAEEASSPETLPGCFMTGADRIMNGLIAHGLLMRKDEVREGKKRRQECHCKCGYPTCDGELCRRFSQSYVG